MITKTLLKFLIFSSMMTGFYLVSGGLLGAAICTWIAWNVLDINDINNTKQ